MRSLRLYSLLIPLILGLTVPPHSFSDEQRPRCNPHYRKISREKIQEARRERPRDRRVIREGLFGRARSLSSIIGSNSFNIGRNLRVYKNIFGRGFSKVLERLKKSDHWLNAGGGMANAEYDYLSGDGPSKVTSVGVARPRGNKAQMSDFPEDRYRYLSGRYIENIPEKELKQFGRPKLITDLYGPLAYSKSPDIVLQKYLDILDEGGSIFMYIGERTTILDGGRERTFKQFLKSIDGLSIKDFDGALQITVKEGARVKVPGLKEVEIEAGKPPYRTFEIEY